MITCSCFCAANRHEGVCLGEVERVDAVIADVRGFPIMMCRPCGEAGQDRHSLVSDAEAVKLAERLEPVRAGSTWQRWFLDQVRGIS